MARYEYRCPVCEAREEVNHPMAEIGNLSEETIENVTCYCNGEGTLMKTVPKKIMRR